MKVSVFKNFLNGERITTCSVEDVARIIRRGDYAAAISDYRCAAPPMLATNINGDIVNKSVRMADNRIPRLCFAAEYRRMNGSRQLLRRNALVLLEIDGLADYATAVNMRNSAARQPYTLMAFVGANGCSVEIACHISQMDGSVPVDDDMFHRIMSEGYKRLHYVYSSQLGVSIPLLAPVDDAMCLMSADAGVYYEPHAVVFTVDLEHKSAAFVGASRDVDGGEESPLPGKTPGEARRYIFYSCWDAVLRSGLDASDPYYAEQAVAMLARYCCRSGLPEQMCVERASLIDGINADRDLVTMLFRQAYAASTQRVNHTAYVPMPALTAMQVDHFFKKRYRLRRNELTGVVEYKPLGCYDTDYRPVTQEVINTMAFLAQREGIRVWARDVKERVNSTLVGTFNPIADYLAALPRWDGRDRLTAFAARVPTSTPEWMQLFAVWMRSMVAHWMGFDRLHGNSLVPLLIGGQGCGKSSFTKIILPEALRLYYNDRIDFRNDNTLMQGLSAFALINIDEFDRYSDHRQPLMKYIISKGEVTAIKAYRSTFSTERRYASFIATTNSPHPLTDPTGSRRFICAAVTDRIDFTSPVDYPQLYAQLVDEVRRGLPYYLYAEAERRLMDENRQFFRNADIDSILSSLFHLPSSAETAQELTASEIAAIVRREYPKLSLTKLSTVEIGRRLKAAGFECRHGKCGNYYKVERVSSGLLH
ncbi:MAG TPA: DUF3874 domain-containing protein [Candidatus Prevotella stercoripullorum]|nr:DUF3874 domain-containing protein [Candidatus Prevotella stercoripullorum]